MSPSRESGQAPGWMPDELAYVGRENLDTAHVASYDAKEDARAAEELALCASLDIGAGSVVIDLGAGTGQFALAAADTGARVIAVDPSPVMLERLRAKADAASLKSLDVVHGGFLTYEHSGTPADLVYSRYALHHLPDFWKAVALRRMHEMLGPGGRLRLWDIVFSFDPAETDDRIEAWCSTLDGVAAADEWNRSDLEEHVRDEHSTFSWLLEPMMERCGFAIERAEYSDDAIFAKYVARAT